MSLKNNILFFIILINCTLSFSQKDDLEFITMYLISGTAKHKLARTIDNIREDYTYLFEKNYTDVFNDYDELIELIETSKKIEVKSPSIFACIELTFNSQKIVYLYFKSTGEFYFDGKWYDKSDCLFYDFFHYFSNEIVPESALKKIKHIEIKCF